MDRNLKKHVNEQKSNLQLFTIILGRFSTTREDIALRWIHFVLLHRSARIYGCTGLMSGGRSSTCMYVTMHMVLYDNIFTFFLLSLPVFFRSYPMLDPSHFGKQQPKSALKHLRLAKKLFMHGSTDGIVCAPNFSADQSNLKQVIFRRLVSLLVF